MSPQINFVCSGIYTRITWIRLFTTFKQIPGDNE